MTVTQTLGEKVLHAWNTKNKAQIFDLYTEDFIREDIGTNKAYDLKALSLILDLYWNAFPDMEFVLDDQIISENKIVIIWRVNGTHKGAFMNIPPTNKNIQFYGISILHIRKDKICKVQYSWDEAAMLRQMGLLPNLK